MKKGDIVDEIVIDANMDATTLLVDVEKPMKSLMKTQMVLKPW